MTSMGTCTSIGNLACDWIPNPMVSSVLLWLQVEMFFFFA